MKKETLIKRLKKIGEELQLDNTFSVKSNGKSHKIRALISRENVFAFALLQDDPSGDDSIIFSNITQLTNHIFR